MSETLLFKNISFSNQAPSSVAWLEDLKEKYRTVHIAHPTKKMEDWKYFQAAPLLKENFFEASDEPTLSVEEKELIRQKIDIRECTFVFVDGFFNSTLSHLQEKKPWMKLIKEEMCQEESSLKSLIEEAEKLESNSFTVVNNACLDKGVYFSVPAGEIFATPVRLLFIATTQEAFVPLRNIVELKEKSSLSLSATFIDLCDLSQNESHHKYFTNVVTDIFLSKKSKLNFYQIQQENSQAYHLHQMRILQERSSTFSSYSLATGAKISRNSIHVALNAPETHVSLQGFHAGTYEQHTECFTFIKHNAPLSHSNQDYKMIASHKSTGVFSGCVEIPKDSQKVTARQMSKNILLDEGSEIFVKPHLRISADDVKCSHGATVGPLRGDELFYFKSRGIPEKRAKTILCEAFASSPFQNIVEEIPKNRFKETLKNIELQEEV